MKNAYKLFVFLLTILTLSCSAFATTFTDKFQKCSPYVFDEGNKVVQIVGYMNRLCVYRELSLDENVQCHFPRKERTVINEELKMRNYIDTNLSQLQSFKKYSQNHNICIPDNNDIMNTIRSFRR